MDKFECGKTCFLNLIYPNSNASIACDLDCHFLYEGEKN